MEATVTKREGGNLMDAHTQWAKRPADERFWGLEDWGAAALRRKEQSATLSIKPTHIRFDGEGERLKLFAGDAELALSNWSFGQLCNRVEFPRSAFVDESGEQRLPADLAAEVLNYRLGAIENDSKDVMLYLDKSRDISGVRAVTSTRFGRVWDADLIPVFERLQSMGYRTPPAYGNVRPATESDVFEGTRIRPGDMIGPAGWYGGDRDSFVLLVNPDQRIDDGKSSMFRMAIVQNSEVGASSLKITTAWLREVCGNHILWGCEDVIEIKVKHLGEAGAKWAEHMNVLKASLEPKGFDSMRASIGALQRFKVADSVQDAVDSVYAMRLAPAITRKFVNNAYTNAAKFVEQDGDPLTGWGTVQALTRESQNTLFAGERQTVDLAIGSLTERFAQSAGVSAS